MKKYILPAFAALTAGLTAVPSLTSCSDWLEKEPLSYLVPENYYNSSAQLTSVLMDLYPKILGGYANWSYGTFGDDAGTDNQVGVEPKTAYTAALYKVPHSGGDYNFTGLYDINFALTAVRPLMGTKADGSDCRIAGDIRDVRHTIGELRFLRAWWYFKKLSAFGDYPIITEPLPVEMDALQKAARRAPRAEVARFILADLDTAAVLMAGRNMTTQRINRDLAVAFKSTVALFEGTWEMNFRGTPFAETDDSRFFLSEACKAAKEIGDAYIGKLTANTGLLQQSADEPANPYYEMFGAEDMSVYPEIMLWRQYGKGMSTHHVPSAAGRGNARIGVTRGFVQNFLMADGTPVYTHGSYADGDGYYQGDRTLADVRANRDTRLSVFLKEPGQKNILYELDNNEGTEAVPVEPYPSITLGDAERGYATGYALRKGGNFNRKYYANGAAYTGQPFFRTVEALLNYIEASYLLNGNIDETADKYWRTIRARAGIDTDYEKTISLTDMAREAENDWGAYTAGQTVDPTLYNIRRERRCEFVGEGHRWRDLCRWRSMDQLIQTPYHIEGFHLWNTPMTSWYDSLTFGIGLDSEVSSPDRSEYLRPFEKYESAECYNGCTWHMAHYLEPVPVEQILMAAPDFATPSQSLVKQNPYWPAEADRPAEQ